MAFNVAMPNAEPREQFSREYYLLNCVFVGVVDVGSAQQIIESANAVPSVTVTFQHNAVFAGFVSPTVVLSKEINEQFAMFARHARVHHNFSRLLVEIV